MMGRPDVSTKPSTTCSSITGGFTRNSLNTYTDFSKTGSGKSSLAIPTASVFGPSDKSYEKNLTPSHAICSSLPSTSINGASAGCCLLSCAWQSAPAVLHRRHLAGSVHPDLKSSATMQFPRMPCDGQNGGT